MYCTASIPEDLYSFGKPQCGRPLGCSVGCLERNLARMREMTPTTKNVSKHFQSGYFAETNIHGSTTLDAISRHMYWLHFSGGEKKGGSGRVGFCQPVEPRTLQFSTHVTECHRLPTFSLHSSGKKNKFFVSESVDSLIVLIHINRRFVVEVTLQQSLCQRNDLMSSNRKQKMCPFTSKDALGTVSMFWTFWIRV